ncbi:MAG: DUF4330 domain-containing protein [Vallitaleaceae bacterium]|jgi:hypothetical protein|nr:DUF4330 domain-containing protein [Vallitaleaceae bacterium]
MRKGSFNIVDIFVVIGIVAILILVVWYLFLKDAPVKVADDGSNTVTFVAKAYELEKEAVDQLKIGDKLVALDVYQPGKIVDFIIEPSKKIEAINGEIVIVKDPTLVDITVTMEVVPNKQKAYMDMGSQQIIVGIPYWIKTEAMHAEGIIVSIED